MKLTFSGQLWMLTSCYWCCWMLFHMKQWGWLCQPSLLFPQPQSPATPLSLPKEPSVHVDALTHCPFNHSARSLVHNSHWLPQWDDPEAPDRGSKAKTHHPSTGDAAAVRRCDHYCRERRVSGIFWKHSLCLSSRNLYPCIYGIGYQTI